MTGIRTHDGTPTKVGLFSPGYRDSFRRVGACSKICYRRFCRCDSVEEKWRLK
jgi:hypothetical protein